MQTVVFLPLASIVLASGVLRGGDPGMFKEIWIGLLYFIGIGIRQLDGLGGTQGNP